MDTSLRQSVILQMLNSSSGTCVSLLVSQTPPNSCSSIEAVAALMSLQTKNWLCDVWLQVHMQAAGGGEGGGGGEAQSKIYNQKSHYFIY